MFYIQCFLQLTQSWQLAFFIYLLYILKFSHLIHFWNYQVTKNILTFLVTKYFILIWLFICKYNFVISTCTRQDGETWHLDDCKSCMCQKGETRCAMQRCPPNPGSCPPNYKLIKRSGQCCAQCVESKCDIYKKQKVS